MILIVDDQNYLYGKGEDVKAAMEDAKDGLWNDSDLHGLTVTEATVIGKLNIVRNYDVIPVPTKKGKKAK